MQAIMEHLWQDLDHPANEAARENGIRVRVSAFSIDLIKQTKIVRFALHHAVYLGDLITLFDTCFESVEPLRGDGFELADFSTPRFHNYIGFDQMPIHTPSFPESVATSSDYMKFASLKRGQIALDLGGYCGLTSLLMQESVGKEGTVICVEPDEYNVVSIRKNFSLYNKITGMSPFLENKAVWKHDAGIEFCAEGNMGSAASEILKTSRDKLDGKQTIVETITLSGIFDKYNLDRVDFIKCDIEGAEKHIFQDEGFFEKSCPKIVIEPHNADGQLTTNACVKALEQFGYESEVIAQTGVKALPLIYCSPKAINAEDKARTLYTKPLTKNIEQATEDQIDEEHLVA